MGRPLPGYTIVLLDPDGEPADEGEICSISLEPRPLGLMAGYRDDAATHRRGDARRLLPHRRRRAAATPTATSPTSAAPTTCSRPRDYRISPFELESVLIEHPAVAEAAVVPSPDPLRLAVPKAFVVLRRGLRADAETARVDLRVPARAPGAVQAHPPDRVRRAAEDDLRQDPPRRAARARGRRARRGAHQRRRVRRRGGARGLNTSATTRVTAQAAGCGPETEVL